MKLFIWVAVLFMQVVAKAEIQCATPGDIPCWRQAALEKIQACNNDVAQPLKDQIDRLEKVSIKAGKVDDGAAAATYYGNQLWNKSPGGRFWRTTKPRIVLRKDVATSKMWDLHINNQKNQGQDMPQIYRSSTLALIVHEMSHVAGADEIGAHQVADNCVDTWTLDVACGFVFSNADGTVNYSKGIYGRCDTEGLQKSEEAFRAKLISGEFPREPALLNFFRDPSVFVGDPTPVQLFMGQTLTDVLSSNSQ